MAKKAKLGLVHVLLIAGALLAFALAFTQGNPQEAANAASEGDLLTGAKELFGLDATNASSEGTWVVYVQYDQGSLIEMTKQNIPGYQSTLDAKSTAAAAADEAKFVMKCGTTTCGQVEAGYQEPQTFFQVHVPHVEGLTRLQITAGAATLSVNFG